jgi:hypothetical protein
MTRKMYVFKLVFMLKLSSLSVWLKNQVRLKFIHHKVFQQAHCQLRIVTLFYIDPVLVNACDHNAIPLNANASNTL